MQIIVSTGTLIFFRARFALPELYRLWCVCTLEQKCWVYMSIRKCIVLISSSCMTSILCNLVFTKPLLATKPVKEEHPGMVGDGSSSASANEKVN